MQRRKIVSVINIVGLSIGIASCVLMLLWIRFETGYDKFHEKLENIYLIGTHHQYGTTGTWSDQSPPALGPAMVREYPEVVDFTRITNYGSRIIKYGEAEFAERLFCADPGFFRIFSFRFVEGDPGTALTDRYSIVMTESMARKYFGDEPALGKTVRVNYEWDLTVSGVVADIPANSTLRFQLLLPFDLVGSLPGWENYLLTWYNCSFNTYVQLREDADIEALGQEIAGRIERSDPETNLRPFLFPFADLNLHSVSGEGGFITVLIMFAIIALVILAIACINFMNLATARSGERAREVGIRKALGASRRELIAQFYFESLLQAFLALMVAFVLVEQFLPRFEELLPWIDVGLDFSDPVLIVGALLVTLVAGIAAGSYPALLLSSFRPGVVLKGMTATGGRGAVFRRALVVLQFGATVVLLICASIVYKQFEFMETKPVGYDRENLAYMPMDDELKAGFDAFKQALLRSPDIIAVAKGSRSLAGIYTNGHNWDWQGRDPNVNPLVSYLGVGIDYQDVMRLEVVEGRFFSKRDAGGDGSDVVVNETFARLIGGGSVLGKTIHHDDHDDPDVTDYTIVGVVKDFHYKPLHAPIGPLLIEFDNERSNNFVFIRFADGARGRAVAHVEKIYREFRPDRLFELTWVADEYENLYRFVEIRGDVLQYYAIIAICLSCLGLYGLASYMTEQRSKEIGIRKVLGASVVSVVSLLTRDFVRWVVVANAIAWPVAYSLIRGYLEGFSYRADPGIIPYVLVSLLSILLATLAVSVQAVRAALSDPAQTIRYE